jgi:hypothetical protein
MFSKAARVFSQKKKTLILVSVCFFAWMFLHMPGMFYQTETATFMTYTGDEQSPVNGALHMLEEKSPLGLRNHETLYYGPIFAVLALPAVVWDYTSLFVSGQIHGAADYKNSIIWNWGGILWKVRVISVLAGFLGIVAFYFLLNTKTMNPSRNKYVPLVGALALASNFFYFEYASFFRHWIFLVAFLFAQIYALIKITEDEEGSKKYWVYALLCSLASFGVSYISIFFQAIWLPVLWFQWKEKKSFFWKRFLVYSGALVFGMALIVWWHPYAFFRMFGWIQSGTMGDVPDVGPKVFSYGEYLRILANGLFPLWILWFALIAHLVSVKKVHRLFWFWIPLVAGAVYFAVFGSYAHFESRYVLPLVAFFFLSFFSLLSHHFEYFLAKPIWRTSVVVFLLFTFVFHAANISAWDYRFLSHASEEKTFVGTLMQRQNENKNFSVLVTGGDLLGVPHTKEAYLAYMENCGRENVRLFESLLDAPFPQVSVPLNVYYDCGSSAGALEEKEKYTTRAFVFKPSVEQDFYDANMGYLWFVDDFRTTYFLGPEKI